MRPESGFFGRWPARANLGATPFGLEGVPIAPSPGCASLGAAWSAREGQACWADAGHFALAFHGEIYNQRSLCAELELAPATPLPMLLCAAWQRWSVEALQRLDGVFAVAVSDSQGVLLYRDPSGLRSLFFHAVAGREPSVTFATHLDSLLQLPEVPRRLSRRSLHEYLRFLDIAAPLTFFEGVQAVEAGQLQRWSAQGVLTASHPQAPGHTSPTVSFTEATELLDAHLRRSVQTRMDGASRPAAFLSGGIDSSLLCALAAAQRGDVTAVTVGFDAAPFDEAPIAQRIAAHLGMAHEVLRFDRAQYEQAFNTLAQGLEQPMADPATPATVLVYGHCRSRYDAVLDGMGADEAVGAMPPRHVRLAVAQSSRIPPALRHGLARMLRVVPGLSGYAPIVDFEHPADTMIRWRGFSRLEIERLCGEPVSFADTQFYRTFARYPRHAHYQRYSALLDAMPCERLNQATLVTGASVRFPFWDQTTDRYIRQLRTDFRYLPSQPKRILRALLALYVPPAIWDLPKHSFDFPLHAFLAGDDFALVRRHLDRERWQAFGLLDARAVSQLAQQFIGGARHTVFRIWTLVVLGAWLETHGELH